MGARGRGTPGVRWRAKAAGTVLAPTGPAEGEASLPGVESAPGTAGVAPGPAAAGRMPASAVAGARQVGRAVLRHIGVVAVFAVPAVALWWHAWDGHLGTTLACSCGDSGQEVWFVAWPAFALAHGGNPLFSGALYAPDGVNLLVNTSAPLVGIVLAPVTWLAGPVVSTNLALTLSPALSAWGAWVACRRLTAPGGWTPAAWIGGLLFGYSPFVVDNAASGHVMMALLVVPPLIVVALYELLASERGSPWRWGAVLGVLVFLQSLISLEVLTMTVVVLVPMLVLAAALSPRAAVGGIRRAAIGLGTGTIVGAALTSYPAWFVLDGPRHLAGSPWPGIAIEGNRLFDLWDPGTYAAPADSLMKLAGYEGLAGPPIVYLGFGVLVLAGLALVVARRRRLAWVLGGGALVAFVLSLGLELWTSGTGAVPRLWMPWQALDNLPLLDRVAPQRFTALTDLLIAVLLAVGLDTARRRLATSAQRPPPSPRRRLAWSSLATGVVALAGIGALVPLWTTYQLPLATNQVSVPRWFATTGRHVPSGSVVLSYPYPFPSAGTSGPMVWQSVDAMRFSLAGGYAKAPSSGGGPLSVTPTPADAILAALTSPAAGALPRGTAPQVSEVRTAIDRWGVRYVVVTDGGRAPGYAAALFTAVVGRAPARRADAWVWHLRATATGPVIGPPSRAPAPRIAAAALASCTGPGVASTMAASAPAAPGRAAVACVAARLGVDGPSRS
ncbi:MAG: hypothetical protein ACYCU7_10635 [Acidimicrobiales bacterium]